MYSMTGADRSGLQHQYSRRDLAIWCRISDAGTSCGNSQESFCLQCAKSTSLQRTEEWKGQVWCVFWFSWAVLNVGHVISSLARPSHKMQERCVSWHLTGTDHLKTEHWPGTRNFSHVPPDCRLQWCWWMTVYPPQRSIALSLAKRYADQGGSGLTQGRQTDGNSSRRLNQ